MTVYIIYFLYEEKIYGLIETTDGKIKAERLATKEKFIKPMKWFQQKILHGDIDITLEPTRILDTSPKF